MKYYFCIVKEVSGECEYTNKFLLKTHLGDEYIAGAFRSICMDWYSGTGNHTFPDSTGCIWSKDTRAIDYGKSHFKEVPESDFNVLKKYITEL